MAREDAQPERSPVTSFLAAGRDTVSLLRDVSLLLLAILLIAFPSTLNSILVNAGFVEGSIAGFKWQSKLLDSDSALQEAQATIADLKKQNDEMSATLSEANRKISDPSFTDRVETLQKENTQSKAAAEQVQTSVARTIASNAPLLEKTAAQHPMSDYLVGVQTLGAPAEFRLELNSKLRSAGYGLHDLTASYAEKSRPSWFAQQSTVFYYATSALPAAQELARTLAQLTGEEFVVQRGSGRGVDPSQQGLTLFVHYIGK